MRIGKPALGWALALALAACGGTSAPDSDPTSEVPVDPPAEAPAPHAPVQPDEPEAVEAGDGSLTDRHGNPIALVPFDIESLPVSAALPGELPFFSLPAGYAPVNRPQVRRYARFPFRMGDGLHWVEGASWNSTIGVDRDADRDKAYSARELRRNLEAVLTQAGARKVFEGMLGRDLYYGPQIEDEIGGGFSEGVNMGNAVPTSVHVIRLADSAIWVQLSTDTHQAALVIVEAKPFAATAHWSDAFPYLSFPAGYDQGNVPKTRDFDMYPFWTGDGFEEVEGRTFSASVQAKEGARSVYEVRRNLESMMAEAGGTRVFEGRIPKAASERYDSQQKSPYNDGTGFSWHDYESLVYRVDRPDGRQIWVHARLEYSGSGWVVVEREDLVQTSALLQADALKRQLDADGRVAIQVNFAVDRADILPASQPQIEQVLALLDADPTLSLSIEGHTDTTGTAARNRSLSQARAASVVAALTARGVDAARLSAAGFGQDRPVADNDSEDGRARNRRVELVKRSRASAT